MRKLLAVLFIAVSLTPAANATSGPGCLIVTNVADDDALNMRSRPSASSRIVDQLVPGQHGIIHLDAPCTPLSRPVAAALVPGQPLQCGSGDPWLGEGPLCQGQRLPVIRGKPAKAGRCILHPTISLRWPQKPMPRSSGAAKPLAT